MRLFPNPRSIAFRLIAAVLTVEAISAILVIAISFGYERHIHFTAFEVMLHGRADSILGAVQDSEDPQDDLILNQADLRLPSDLVWQVAETDGRILGRSPNWPGPAALSGTEPHHGLMRMSLNHRHYAVIRAQGSREVDPGTPNAKVHRLTIYCGSPVDPVWHAVWGAVEFYGAGSVLLLLVTGPLIAWLLQRGLTPVRQLAALASQVSVASWRFNPPPTARSTPELAPLTLAIENVLERLERSFNQQHALVSDAAHELKTAVAVVKSSLQVLSLRPRSVTEYEAGLARCLSDIERLEALVSQMLTMARVEAADRASSAETSTSLVACVEQTIQNLASFAELRRVNVHASLHASTDAAVPLDAEDSLTLVSNLLLNALQHSPAQSRVEVRVTPEHDGLQLTVSDQGEGLDPAALPHIFQRFYRGDPSRSRATGGSGLGLAICKALVDRASGTIAIENNTGSPGATATVWLPAPPAPSSST